MKIAYFDIETSYNLGICWGKWEQNIIEFEKEWKIICFSIKWEGGKTEVYALPDFPLYKKDKENDRDLVKKLWEKFNEADILVAHNGDQFDIKKSNSRFLFHGLTPPSFYKTIDTKKVAKRYFNFNSNKLDDIGEHLGLGRKLDTGGFKLWKDCMAGDLKAWKKMKTYNKQDVLLLEKVYKAMLPWIQGHPNLNLLNGTSHCCPNCGSDKVQRRGYAITRASKMIRFQCQACGAWSQTPSETKLLR